MSRFPSFSKKQARVLSFWASPDAGFHGIICDGAIRSGKSACMSLSFVLWAFFHFHEQTFAFCGKTISSLKRNLIAPLLSFLEPLGFSAKLSHSRNCLDLSIGSLTNRFFLFGGKDQSSASLIQGITLAGVLLDEVTLMPRSFVEQAVARCSLEDSLLWFNCNPDSPSHWFYQDWILPANAKNLLYLHFSMDDNPSLSPKVRKRYEALYAGPFYQRFVLGEWTASQDLVYPFLSADSFCNVPQGSAQEYVISCDYGTVNPSSFGLWAKFQDTWYRVDEYYYDSKFFGVQRTDDEHLAALLELAGDKNVRCVIVDPSAASFRTLIQKHSALKTIPAQNHVLDGIRQVSVALKQGKIRICRNCIHSIREFGLYRWKENADVPQKVHDHAMDDIRYFVSTFLHNPPSSTPAFAAPRRSNHWS